MAVEERFSAAMVRLAAPEIRVIVSTAMVITGAAACILATGSIVVFATQRTRADSSVAVGVERQQNALINGWDGLRWSRHQLLVESLGLYQVTAFVMVSFLTACLSWNWKRSELRVNRFDY